MYDHYGNGILDRKTMKVVHPPLLEFEHRPRYGEPDERFGLYCTCLVCVPRREPAKEGAR